MTRRQDESEEDDREEQQLRTVALQNAQSILLARQRAEEALRKQSEWLRITLSSIGDAVISTDAEGLVTFLNGVAEALTGWTQAEAAGRPLPDVFHIIDEHTRVPAENPALRALREGTVVALANHTILIARDKSERPIDDSAAPIRDGAGAPVGAVLVFRDVTERKRAEQAQAEHGRLVALRGDVAFALASEQDLRIVLQHAAEAIVRHLDAAFARVWTLDDDGRMLELQASAGLYTHIDGPHARVRVGEYKIGRIAANQQPHLTNSVPDDPNVSDGEWARREGMAAFAGYPLVVEGRVVGVLALFSRRRLSDAVFTDLAPLADGVAQFIQRKRSEQALRASDGRHRFLAELASATQILIEPDAIMAATARLLAEHLAADRCAYAEVEDESIFVITGDYQRGVPSIVGRWPVAAFGPECERLMLANVPYVMDDVETDPRAGVDLSAYRATDIRAVICVPLHKEAKFTAAMAVHQKTPRRWTPEEIQLVHTVVGRCWEALERARATRLLQESEAKFRRLAETIPQLAWMAHADGHIFWYNRRWYEYTGTTPEEMEGWGWQKVHDPEVLPLVLDRWKGSIASGEPFDMVFPIKGSDGIFRPFLTRVNPLKDDAGRVAQWFGTNTDVSAQKNAEMALRESEQRFRTLADKVPVQVWMDDERGRAVLANARYLEYTGIAAEDLMNNSWPDVVHPDDKERYLGEYQAAAAARSEHRAEVRLRRQDGVYRWFEVIALPRYEGERFAGFVGISLDVSDRKQAQEALREADRRKDEFIALLAHELRNPLAPLRNGLQVMRLASDDADAVAQARDMMERQLGHMVRLVDDLLDISRISQNKMELRRSRLLLADVVSSAVETARPSIEAASHELTVSLPTEHVYLDADLTRLAQVLSNLLTNSAKYTERGGRIWLVAESKGGEVVVSVRDNGIGIPAESLPRIFDMFSQVDRSIERSTGGLGIGLALVKGLVEMHDGTVTADSEGPGMGSTFTIKLPALGSQSRLEADSPSNNGQTSIGPRRRVLIVDDHRDAANSMAMMLQLLGNDVRTAHDGLKGVETAEQFRPEVILMDVGMPRLNGLDATRRIREQPWGQGMTIIALTGWGQDADRYESKGAGCDGHLVKPVHLTELEKLLTSVANARSSSQLETSV